MNQKRLIGRLDIKNSNLIKSINLEGLRILGNPNKFAKSYYDQGIDELIFIDVVATLYGRNYSLEILKKITQEIFIPITIGGGVRSIEDAKNLLLCGADKIAINSQAVKNPKFIKDLVKEIGSQSTIVSIEAKEKKGYWEVFTSNGREQTGINVLEWIKKVIDLGAGEILLTSIDKEGTRSGFDNELVEQASKICSIPLIVSGGFGEKKHLDNILQYQFDAVAIADSLHYNRHSISEIKEYLEKKY